MPDLCPRRSPHYLDMDLLAFSQATDPVFPFEIWTVVDHYIPWRVRLALSATCKTIRYLLPPKFECVTLALVDSPRGLEDHTNQRLLHKITFFTSPHIAPTVKFCRLCFYTRQIPSLPATADVCTFLFSALARFKNLTDLDCFRILFNERHVSVIKSLPNLTRAEFTECQWVHRQPVPFEDRMHLHHLLVDHGPNKHRYNWLFNTHPDHLTSLVLTSGMPADFISGFLPPLPNLESLEINGMAMLHPELPALLSLCPGLIELRVTTDRLFPGYIRAAYDVMAVIPPDCIPDLRVYEGPAKFLSAFTKGRLVTHVGAFACPLYQNYFTFNVGSAFKKQQVRSLRMRVPRVTEQVLALMSYFKAALAVEISVTNEDEPVHSRQTCRDILTMLDQSIFPPPPNLQYLSLANENTIWGTPKESPWYKLDERSRTGSFSLSPDTESSYPPLHLIPPSIFIKKCHKLRYAMLSDDSGVIVAWNPQTRSRHVEIETFRQWQRHRLGLFDPVSYDSF